MTEIEQFWRDTGSQGGKKRAAKLTKAQRSAIAKKAAKARWKKEKAEGRKR